MNKIWTIVIAFAVIAGGLTVWQMTDGNKDMTSTQKSSQTPPSGVSAMQKQYAGYKGETYDRMYLAGMMAYHVGAVDMAKLALTNAKHQELKDLASDIVTAQTSEITSMTSWQSAWGYPATSGANMQDHSAMMMEDEMAGMTNELKGKTGDEFDKSFITQMMAHHQEAIDMSKSATTNASHQQVKDLAQKITTAQTKEISEMRSWQTQWGYKKQSSTSGSTHSMSM